MANFVSAMHECGSGTLCEDILRWILWIIWCTIPIWILTALHIEGLHPNDDTNGRVIFWAMVELVVGSISIIGLYLYPWFIPNHTWFESLEKATKHWIAISVLEELLFQLPQNIFQDFLYSIQGTNSPIEWPLFVYACLCDSRWDTYDSNGKLGWEIFVCNIFEGGSGLILILILYFEKYVWKLIRYIKKSDMIDHMIDECNKYDHSRLFILYVIFRDAMLLRQTVGYCMQHHMNNYPYSFKNDKQLFDEKTGEIYRMIGIGGIYSINGLFMLAPMLSIVWGYIELTKRNIQYKQNGKDKRKGKTKSKKTN